MSPFSHCRLHHGGVQTLRTAAAGLGVFLTLGTTVADALTIHHHYAADPARIQTAPSPDGARVIRVADGFESAHPTTWEAGRPELPYDVVTFVVPRGSRITAVRARLLGEITVSSGIELAPAAPVWDEMSRARLPKAGVLSLGTYPAALAEPLGTGALHGYELASVRVYPVRWDAAGRTLTAATGIDLEIDLAPGGAQPLQRERYRPGLELLARRTLERLVANPQDLDGYDRRIGVRVESAPGAGFHPSDAPSLEGSDVDAVIITSNALASTWQALADWKTRRGVPTVLRTVEWIEANYRRGSDRQETIRTFIRDAYTKWGVRYVLLAGDTDTLPARYGYSGFGEESEQSIPSDMYFACLDGNWNRDGDARWGEGVVDFSDAGDSTDLYAEVFVGRVPLASAVDAGAFIGKVIAYENPVITDYQSKVVMIGEVIFPADWTGGTITLDGGIFSDEVLTYHSACVDSVRLYENYTAFPGSIPLTKSNTLAQLNAGAGFVNHIGHGFRYNMSCGDASIVNDDAFALTNGDRRFILYMANCTAAAFDFPCLAEAYLESPGGAVAVLGATRSAFALPSRNYNREFFRAVHTNGYAHLGEAFVQSRLPFTPNASFDTSDHYTHLLYNYLGDPEMVMHTCNPVPASATAPATIAVGPQTVTVHVENSGQPRAGALVCLSKGASGAEAYAFATTDSLGDAVIALRPESPGTIQLTVSGQNMTTVLDSIVVEDVGTPSVHIQALTLDDGTAPPAGGNADGILDAGDVVALDVTAVNDGSIAADSLVGVLHVASPWATVTDSIATFGAIAGSGGQSVSTHELAVAVDPQAPDGTVLPFEIVFADSAGGTWTDAVNRVVHAPAIAFTLLRVDDAAPGGNNDGVVQAGETFDLRASFKNYGSGAADGLVASIATADSDLVVLEDSVLAGRLNPGQEFTGPAAFRLTENSIDENPLTLTIADSHGRTRSWPVTLRAPAKPATPLLSTRGSANTIASTWTPSTDTDLAGYHVYRALGPVGPWTRVTIDRTVHVAYYMDTGLLPTTKYYYRVTAVDVAGNESTPSNTANINTAPAQLANWPILLSDHSTSAAAVGDMTGDGSKEVIAAASRLCAWNWNGIELLDGDNDAQSWGVLTPAIKTVTAAVSMANVDGNPGLEVFCGAWDDSTKAFVVRADGSMLPGWPRNPEPNPPTKGYWASTAAVDVDNDGVAELFAPSRNGSLFAWHADGSPLGATAAFKTGFGANVRTSPAFANLDADPALEIVFVTPTGQLNVWNADGSSLPGYPVNAGTACLSNPAIGDVNLDGVLDIVFLTEGGGGFVHVFNSATATELPGWPRTLTIKGNPISPSPALADFDGDSKLEIVVANNGGTLPSLSRMQVFDWQGNTVLGWPRTVGSSNAESSPVVADVSGDGVPDILFGNESGLLFGWDWHGIDLPGFPITVGDFIRSTPYVDDIDGDGRVNVILAGWDKNVYVWDFPTAWYPEAAQWPALKHDVHRSGTYAFVVDTTPPVLPATLTSPSHAVSTWSNDTTVDVTWTAAIDPSGVGGYSVLWDQSPASVPDDTVDTAGTSATSPTFGDGVAHWFHLRAVDLLGHWTSDAVHFGPFWIDTIPPSGGVTSLAAVPPPGVWTNDNTVDAAWIANADSAGAAPLAFSWVWDADSTTVPDAIVEFDSAAATSPELADGAFHWFHVRVVDQAGNAAPDSTTAHLGVFWVDTAAPADPDSFTSTPAAGIWVEADSILVHWSGAADTLSGVAAYSVVFDQVADSQPDTAADSVTATALASPVPDGQTWFHIRTRDVAGNWSAGSHYGPVQIDRLPPEVLVHTPNGGESWETGTNQVLRWHAADAGIGVQAIEVRLSTDGGSTFPDLIAALSAPDSQYVWNVPAVLTSQGRIRVQATDALGTATVDSSDADFAIVAPSDLAGLPAVTRTWLDAVHPNPFNPTASIRYSLVASGRVRLEIYDARGRLVRTLFDAGQAGPQWYTAVWNGRDNAGRALPGGVYFARLRTPSYISARRLVLVK